MPSYKITYFNVHALAEPSRWLLKYANIDFEDERFGRAEWPEIKPKMPFGQVPILTIDGQQYPQSMAIARYCAKEAKLVGKNAIEDLEIDAIVDVVNDLRQKLALYSYEQDAAIKEARKGPLFKETVPYFLDRLEKVAADNNGHLACKRLTWADFYFSAMLDYFNYMAGMDLLQKHPNLQAVSNNVTSIPQVKKWVEERPKGSL